MAPRRGKKVASATTTVEPVPAENGLNDIAQVDSKPAKGGAKKTKAQKNVEQTKQVEEEAASVKTTNKTKKAVAAQKIPEKIETAAENGNGTNGDTNESEEVKTKSKKAPAKKNVKKQDVPEDTENATTVIESPQKPKKRGAKAKQMEEPKEEAKGTKGRPKKGKPALIEEDVDDTPGPSKTTKKAAKSKQSKVEATVENDIAEKNVGKQVKPVAEKANKKPGKSTAVKAKGKDSPKSEDQQNKKAEPKAKKSKQQKQQTDDQVDNVESSEGVESKGDRKRKPDKAENASPSKKSKKESAVSSTTVKSPEPKTNTKPTKRKAGTKVAVDSTTNDGDGEDELVTKRKKVSKNESKAEPKAKMNETDTDFSVIAFDSVKEHSLKIVSWNVAGLRALVTKGGFDYFEYEKPDIICLQEIKCLEEDVPKEAKLNSYHPYWCSTPGGRGGVAILSKQMPYSVQNNIGDEEMDKEGRIITAEYSKFYLVCVYVPNAGRKLVNLDLRLRWNKKFEDHITKLKAMKPVIICGDMNVAHEEIDLANPKSNIKSAGFTKEEREGMTDLLELGFVDTFRQLHPDEGKAYTFWNYIGGARARNVGWRLDYSLVSENLKPKVVDSFIRPQILGSDHCPIVLLLNL